MSNTTAQNSRTVLRKVTRALGAHGQLTRGDLLFMQPKVAKLVELAKLDREPTDAELAHAILNFGWMVEGFLAHESNGANAQRQARSLANHRAAFEIVMVFEISGIAGVKEMA